jgi:hypothetical protein
MNNIGQPAQPNRELVKCAIAEVSGIAGLTLRGDGRRTDPAAARGPYGEFYLFPRLTARGNYSRIGIARVRFDQAWIL